MSNPSRRKRVPGALAAVLLALACGPALAHHHHDTPDQSNSSHATATQGSPAATSASAPVPAVAPSTPAEPASTASGDIPDYGGRDTLVTAAGAAGGDSAASPLSQAFRAFQALVVVLVLIAGALYYIKKHGLLREGGLLAGFIQRSSAGGPVMHTGFGNVLRTFAQAPKPADTAPVAPPIAGPVVSTDPTAALTLLSSTPLPGSAPVSVHLIEVAGRRFLLGASGGGMSLLADWDSDPPVDEGTEPPLASEEEHFESYLNRMGLTAQTPPEVVGERVSQTTDRLQALLMRTREEAAE